MKPFLPYKLPFNENINPMSFLDELISANRNLSKYEILLEKAKIDEDLLLGTLGYKEAHESTKIEGTRATFDDVMKYEIDNRKKNDDLQEIKNYFEALNIGKSLLDRLPISTRLFKKLHEILFSNGVRGEYRGPGQYRTTQNYIGPDGCTRETATFLPPEPQLVDEYMSNLEEYINNPEDDLDPLIRTAIIHAQFETIHPFLDGNGRIGRILIPLYLYDVNLIKSPNLFISEALEKDKHKYYRLLNGTRIEENWNDWISFFLKSIDKQTINNINILKEIENLFERDLKKAREFINGYKIKKVMEYMYYQPVFQVKTISDLSGVSYSTCKRYLDILEKQKIIYSDQKTRNKMYFYYNLLDILR
jgi:Fic family protein